MKNLIINKNQNHIDIILGDGIMMIYPSDFSEIISNWGYSDILESLLGNEMIFSYWKNDHLIIQNKEGDQISFNEKEFINLFI
jgi:hypothetical protein